MHKWTELLGVVAHDLKTPITAVKGFLELIQHSGPLNERQQQFCERAEVGLQHMEFLVGRLLELSWIEGAGSLSLSECVLQTQIDRAVQLLEPAAAGRGIAIQVDYAPGLKPVLADARRLDQVFLNLLSNAIKYNREDGEVHIRVEQTDGFVMIAIRDTGQGIPLDDLPHIFETFFRANANANQKIEGTGLGLAIVKAVVERHGGRVEVTSKLGEGTTFTVVLPRQAEAAERPDTLGQDDGEPAHVDHAAAEGRDTRTVFSSETLDAVNDDFQEQNGFQAADFGEERVEGVER